MEYCSPPSSSSSLSSSPRLSGLSTSTSTSLSSAFSGSDFSSLPSPSTSPAPREAPAEISSPGAKTHAFFASPFSTRPPSPLPQSANASTSTITSSPPPLLVPPRNPPTTPQIKNKRDFLRLDPHPVRVEDLSAGPTPLPPNPDDEATPKLPSVFPKQSIPNEELAVGSILRASAPPRSRTVSTDNSGFLESGSCSPLTQSPTSKLSGLPDAAAPHTMLFSGLPTSSESAPRLTLEPPRPSGTTLRLTAPLGTGAFSSVWLAEDLSDDPLVLRTRRSLRNLRRETSLSVSRAGSLRKVRVPGVRPLGAGKRMLAEQERSNTPSGSSPSTLSSPSSSTFPQTRLVALKITARSAYTQCSGREQAMQRDRTRVSFVREVEVLRHISHRNITTLLTHLTTPCYHVLVLPYVPGGDLLGLVNSDNAHGALGEALLKRIWSELCKAVGWMHGVGLVHRDVKLENILLTTPFPFTNGAPTGPLVKLTDFGLSRFIDTAAPLLSTRCGSEAYAAPELVISGRRYDARETDAWACGVVLYGLCARRLPFGEGATSNDGPGRIGREGGVRESAATRRHWLMCIARGEWEWPSVSAAHEERPDLENHTSADSVATVVAPSENGDEVPETRPQPQPQLELKGEGARRIVSRLLVRDSARRAKISELWDDPWMGGTTQLSSPSSVSTAPLISSEVETQSPPGTASPDSDYSDHSSLYGEVVGFDDEDLEGEDEDADDDGLLLDQEGIDSIARQEVQ
ncbi:kinase-like domain-containing protein [Favolaschia claudopus]|uniref:non-specific serine/threonine protein kinase n=1 Tax=Favolaschia claudopus TaxID=2862362 RepID=A0AAW0BE25_9AGAR